MKAKTITKAKTTENAGPRCHCGASLACWLCLGAGKLRASSARKIDEKDACYGCAGLGTSQCRPCADKLTRKAVDASRQAIKLTA